MQAVLRKDISTDSLRINVNVDKETCKHSGMGLVLTEEHCFPGKHKVLRGALSLELSGC